jgi:hypothetical protein
MPTNLTPQLVTIIVRTAKALFRIREALIRIWIQSGQWIRIRIRIRKFHFLKIVFEKKNFSWKFFPVSGHKYPGSGLDPYRNSA